MGGVKAVASAKARNGREHCGMLTLAVNDSTSNNVQCDAVAGATGCAVTVAYCPPLRHVLSAVHITGRPSRLAIPKETDLSKK
jgi:hypothetical protein